MIDEGYIKFQSHWTSGPPTSHKGLAGLADIRNQLYRKGLIGIYADSGIGYGNVSLRVDGGNTFVISGTRTGGIPVLGPEHFTLVTQVDIAHNSVHCLGPVEASSESMTHAVLYRCAPSVKSVVHVHHLELWLWLQDKIPVSDPEIAYGTPGMAAEVERLFRETELASERVLVMGGHREGIIAFGEDPKGAAEMIFRWFQAWEHACRDNK